MRNHGKSSPKALRSNSIITDDSIMSDLLLLGISMAGWRERVEFPLEDNS